MKINSNRTLFSVAVMVIALSVCAHAADLTAFQLIKEGDRYVGEDVKDQVVQIRSEKSVGSLTPNIWYVVYYDPDATFHATEVKFGGGQKMEVKRPGRMLEYGTSKEKKLDPTKLKVDSDKAFAIAAKDPLLTNLKLTASQLTLEHSDDGPVWRVKLWAAKLRNPGDDANLGEVDLLAEDGRVVKRDLHPDHAD
jgi:hypothetical protein